MLAEWLNSPDAKALLVELYNICYRSLSGQGCTLQPSTNVPYLSVLYLTFPRYPGARPYPPFRGQIRTV